MDADDVSEPARLERQLALMRADPSLVGCGCRVRYVPEEAVRDGARRYEAWLNACVTPEQVAREIFVECPLAHPAFFLRADRVADVDGYREPGWPEDYDLVLRLWKAGGRLANVPEILLRWREAPGRLSRTHPRYSPEAFRRCKVRFLLDTHLADGRAPVIWGAGPLGKAFARALIEAERPPGAFVDVDPRKVGQRIHGAPVLDPREGVTRADSFHLAAVGQPGARARIRGMLEDGGLVDGRDFTAVA